MLCECGEREATVHEVVIKDGVVIERHLCDRCAAQQGVGASTGLPVTELIGKFIMAQQGQQAPQEGMAAPQAAIMVAGRGPACPKCGLAYEVFKRTGLLGCPACYAAFESRLGPLLERAHEGACTHVGKVPRRALSECRAAGDPAAIAILGTMEQRAERLSLLRTKLAEAVRSEQYERAAALRDELTRLEGPGGGPAETRGPGPGDGGGGGVA